MDGNIINGVLRAVVPAVVAYLVGRGVIPAGDYGEVIAGLAAVAAAIWSVISNKN